MKIFEDYWKIFECMKISGKSQKKLMETSKKSWENLLKILTNFKENFMKT